MTVNEYDPPVSPVTVIDCGFPETLPDQLKTNGGSPEVINDVIEPSLPSPQPLAKSENCKTPDPDTVIGFCCEHPVASVTVITCDPAATLVNVIDDNTVDNID